MNKDINLIRSKSQTPFAILFDRITLIRIIAFGMLTTVSTLSIGFFLLVSFSPLPELKKEEQTKRAQMQLLAKKEGVRLGIQDRVNNIKTLLATRSDIAELIQVINDNLSSSMSLSAFSIDKKMVKIQVETNSLSDMDIFLTKMGEKQSITFNQVIMDGISLNQSRGKYVVGLTLQL